MSLSDDQLNIVHKIGEEIISVSMATVLESGVCLHTAIGISVQQFLACGARNPAWLEQFRNADECCDSSVHDEADRILADQEIMQSIQ